MSESAVLFRKVIAAVEGVAAQSVTNLNPPASREAIDSLRAAFPLVPDGLLVVLAIHDGEEPISWLSVFPNGMQLVDVQSILQTREGRLKLPEKLRDKEVENLDELVMKNVMRRPIGPVKPVFQCSKRIPFAQMNWGVVWEVDLDPAPGGSIGQIIEEDTEGLELRVIAPSIEGLMGDYLAAIEAGKFSSDDGQIVSLELHWP